MATLEMIPLRSMMPHTGRVTLRFSQPIVKADAVDVRIDKGAATLPRIATTPQVEVPQVEAALETPVGKGREAR